MVSDDLLKREKQLIHCDTVVVFFTPAYNDVLKSKKETRGVYREYEHISNIFSESEKKIIPILQRGDKKSSIPELFDTTLYKDLSNTTLVKDKRSGVMTVASKDKAMMTNLVSTIIKRTEDMFSLRQYNRSDEVEDEVAIYENLLNMNKANGTLPKDCMIKVDAYDSITTQSCFFVVGRKGSGKSTLFEMLEKYNASLFMSRYKTLIPVQADVLDMNSLYSVFQRHQVDFDVINPNKILSIFWETFITLYTIYIIGIEEENHQILDEQRRKVFIKIINKLKKALNISSFDEDTICEGLYALAIEKIDDFLRRDIFAYANTEALLASITANTSSKKLLETLFGRKIYNDFLTELYACKKKILFSLDGFDYASEDFRRATTEILKQNDIASTNEASLRTLFSKMFYRSLMTSIEGIKGRNNALSHVLNFCVVFPKDRIDEIESIHRDVSKAKFATLDWDGYNLLEMLVLRLEYLGRISNPDEKDLLVRFRVAMNEILPTIPQTVNLEISGINRSIDLVQYLLSLSIWRPRDILLHFAYLFRVDTKTKELQQQKASNEIIKETLVNTTEKIIRQEFIKEYENAFRNISDVLRKLSNLDLIMSSEDFCEKLSKIPFSTTYDIDCSKTDNKISILYELGVVGLLVPERIRVINGLSSRYCYVFNAGVKPIDLVRHSYGINSCEVQYIFNPMFGKFLSLNMNASEIIGDFGWEYLKRNHIMRATTV